MKEDKIKDETEKAWEEIWKPLLYTDGELDIKKIKNEMMDLIFIYQQVGEVYSELTGNMLSKPMYYAGTIIAEHERECEEAYQRGYDDAKELDTPPREDNK